MRLGNDLDSNALDVRLYDFPVSPANVQPITPGSYVHVENGLAAAQALSAFSIECWVRPRNGAAWQGLITQHTYPSACGFGLFLANGRVCAYLGNGGAFQAAGLFTGPTVPDQEWSHLVLTWNGQQVAFYLNGQYASGEAFTGPLVPGSAPMRLGAYGALDDAGAGRTGHFLEGDLAMPVLYARALTAQEVQARHAVTPPTPPAMSGVLACWPLTEERGSTVADLGPSGRTGTIVNQAGWMIGGPGFDASAVPRHGTYVPAQDPTRGHALRFASDDLYDCGWSVTHTYAVPESTPPGLHVARVFVGGAPVYDVPFVVKRAASRPPAQVLVLCAINTWLAYSSPFEGQAAGFPQYSCYTSHGAGQPTFQVGLRMPLRAAGATSLYSAPSVGYSHLVRAERFLHQWLERNGYAFDLVTDLDLHQNPGLLSGYKVLCINGHSEYWSAPAWDGVDAFLTSGGSVVALSGNSLFWRVSFDASGTVMECRKYDAGQGFGGLVDSVGELWHSQDFQRGGLLRECGRPGWKLLGLEASGFVGTDAAQFTALTVQQPQHTFFTTPQATGVVSGSPLGQGPGGALPRAVGHEWDARVGRLLLSPPPPGASVPVEPSGITTLATASKSEGVLDYYGTWHSGTSTIVSEVIQWDRPQGGHVFYVGTIGAGWALSADVALQRLMHNVLYHFHVTLEPAVPAAVVSAQGPTLLLNRGVHGAMRDTSRSGAQWPSSPPAWHDVGTTVVSAPATVAFGPYTSLVAVGSEGSLLSRWWDGTNWGPSATGWQDQGGQLTGAPCSVSRAPWGMPGAFDIFALGKDGSVHHKWWSGTSWGPSATGLADLGGALIGAPVAVNWGTYLTLMAVGTDGALRLRYWDGAQWYPLTGEWQSLGGQLAGPLAVVSRAPAQPHAFEVFALGRDGTIQHKAWDGTQWQPSLTGWTSLGGTFASPPTAVAWGNGAKVSVIAVGTDGVPRLKTWDGAQWSPSLSGWTLLGGSFLGPVSALLTGTNRVDVYAVGTDRAVWIRELDSGSAATNWLSLGV
ncbi:hypothetical protein JGU66_29840 [Myxococcaceae bacterium JPH2]|nr:hypothetical protein [Myxococcaceae bacterium JPH2]